MSISGCHMTSIAMWPTSNILVVYVIGDQAYARVFNDVPGDWTDSGTSNLVVPSNHGLLSAGSIALSSEGYYSYVYYDSASALKCRLGNSLGQDWADWEW